MERKLAAGKLSLATLRGYKAMWRQKLEKHFGKTKLHEYFPRHAAGYLSELALAGLGRNTVSHVRALMHNIFSHATSDGHIAGNPVAVAKPKVEPHAPGETQCYTSQEMALILMALDSDNHAQEHAVMSLAFAGLRRAEIAGLMWTDIDYKASRLRVERSAWGGVAGERAKNRQSKRVVVLGSEVLASLKRWQKKSADTNQGGYVFENSDGGPLELGLYSQRSIHPAFKLLGLTWRGLHAARRAVSQRCVPSASRKT